MIITILDFNAPKFELEIHFGSVSDKYYTYVTLIKCITLISNKNKYIYIETLIWNRKENVKYFYVGNIS